MLRLLLERAFQDPQLTSAPIIPLHAYPPMNALTATNAIENMVVSPLSLSIVRPCKIKHALDESQCPSVLYHVARDIKDAIAE